ncbi:MAG: hypothetical protein ILA04_08710 [Prevotella sp.]|nr:hypothetical protein [Prevotella sp.]
MKREIEYIINKKQDENGKYQEFADVGKHLRRSSYQPRQNTSPLLNTTETSMLAGLL